jgi:hypothetical protein
LASATRTAVMTTRTSPMSGLRSGLAFESNKEACRGRPRPRASSLGPWGDQLEERSTQGLQGLPARWPPARRAARGWRPPALGGLRRRSPKTTAKPPSPRAAKSRTGVPTSTSSRGRHKERPVQGRARAQVEGVQRPQLPVKKAVHSSRLDHLRCLGDGEEHWAKRIHRLSRRVAESASNS